MCIRDRFFCLLFHATCSVFYFFSYYFWLFDISDLFIWGHLLMLSSYRLGEVLFCAFVCYIIVFFLIAKCIVLHCNSILLRCWILFWKELYVCSFFYCSTIFDYLWQISYTGTSWNCETISCMLLVSSYCMLYQHFLDTCLMWYWTEIYITG